MISPLQTPLIRLGNLFAQRAVYAKCEFLAPSGCFKIRGAVHLLNHLSQEGRVRHLVVPSMGNTALGAATGAQAFGFSMTGVVPTTISRYDGVVHGFFFFSGLVDRTGAALEEACSLRGQAAALEPRLQAVQRQLAPVLAGLHENGLA